MSMQELGKPPPTACGAHLSNYLASLYSVFFADRASSSSLRFISFSFLSSWSPDFLLSLTAICDLNSNPRQNNSTARKFLVARLQLPLRHLLCAAPPLLPLGVSGQQTTPTSVASSPLLLLGNLRLIKL
ncbi:hypothetical protein K438DRAFT_1988869 [Mycena galopus ATCC 62051]|nr:hypothetical protein K438DRAFT_1988869 [Mycena galopus ATCC 62051]